MLPPWHQWANSGHQEPVHTLIPWAVLSFTNFITAHLESSPRRQESDVNTRQVIPMYLGKAEMTVALEMNQLSECETILCSPLKECKATSVLGNPGLKW